MVDIPHFDLPFRFDSSGHAVEADQDSLEDVTNCVAAIFRTRHGERLERPLFGIPDQTFVMQPLDAESILESALLFESRAHLLLEQAPDLFANMTADVMVFLTPTGGQS